MKTLEKLSPSLIGGLIGVSMWAAQVPPVSPAIAEFQKRVADYLKVRKSVASAVPTLKASGSPEKIEQHERDLAISLRAARLTAAQGNIFTPDIAAEFRRIIRAAWSAPGADRMKKSVTDSQPSPLPGVAVNGAYPAADPVQSMPPSLLKRLPALPRELEYRAVGRTLILRDIEANLIVDYLNGALP
jgi:hypothetical protein